MFGVFAGSDDVPRESGHFAPAVAHRSIAGKQGESPEEGSSV